MKKLFEWARRIDSLTKVTTFLFVVWIVFTPFYKNSNPLSPSDSFIVLGAVVVQILVGVKVALIVKRFVDRRWRDKWKQKRLDDTIEFYNTLAAESWPSEQIAKVLLSESAKDHLDTSKTSEAPRMRKELDSLVRLSRARREEEKKQPSYRISKLLFKARWLCQKLGESEFDEKLGKQYSLAKRIQLVDVRIGSLLSISLAVFLLVFGLSGVGLSWLLHERVSVLLYWLWPLGFSIIAVFSHSVLLKVTDFYVRWGIEKSRTEWDDVIVGIVSSPVSIAITLVFFTLALGSLPLYLVSPITSWLSNLTSQLVWKLIIILFLSWIGIAFFNRVLMHGLKRWAATTETQYDDMFVRILQVFGSFLMGAIALGAIIVNFQPQVQAATGLDNLLLPYSIVVSILGAILGYAFRESLENFFSMMLMQIDKPFEKGDRLVLETGEICDVTSLGMRSTTLYNVLQNTEVSIPNRVLANQKITNISRPDRQLRVQIPVFIPNELDTLARAEELLLDIAYLSPEIDEARFTDKDFLGGLVVDRGRRGAQALVIALEKTFPQIKDTVISRIVGGEAREEPVFADISSPLHKHLEELSQLRETYQKLSGDEVARLKILRAIVVKDGWVNEALLAVSDAHTEVRTDMEAIFTELQKEPAVYSSFCVTEEGRSYIKIDLNVYTLHLARRFEVVNTINKEIQERFAKAGIKAP